MEMHKPKYGEKSSCYVTNQENEKLPAPHFPKVSFKEQYEIPKEIQKQKVVHRRASTFGANIDSIVNQPINLVNATQNKAMVVKPTKQVRSPCIQKSIKDLSSLQIKGIKSKLETLLVYLNKDEIVSKKISNIIN